MNISSVRAHKHNLNKLLTTAMGLLCSIIICFNANHFVGGYGSIVSVRIRAQMLPIWNDRSTCRSVSSCNEHINTNIHINFKRQFNSVSMHQISVSAGFEINFRSHFNSRIVNRMRRSHHSEWYLCMQRVF